MSTPIHPRTHQRTQQPARPHTGPTPSHPEPAAPFRWSTPRQLTRSPRPAPRPVPERDVLRSDLPDPGPWAALLARAIVEVVTGARQAPQLRRWLLPDLSAALIVATATRTYALALRLEEYRGRWMTTALELA